MESQPIYLNVAVVFGFLALLVSAIQIYFHFKMRDDRFQKMIGLTRFQNLLRNPHQLK
jgi:hypothetical protein